MARSAHDVHRCWATPASFVKTWRTWPRTRVTWWLGAPSKHFQLQQQPGPATANRSAQGTSPLPPTYQRCCQRVGGASGKATDQTSTRGRARLVLDGSAGRRRRLGNDGRHTRRRTDQDSRSQARLARCYPTFCGTTKRATQPSTPRTPRRSRSRKHSSTTRSSQRARQPHRRPTERWMNGSSGAPSCGASCHLPRWRPAPSIFILCWRISKGAKMKLVHCLVAACSVALLSSLQPTAEAVALRPNKATDDSVCDLAHDTIGFLGGSLLIPASASQSDQVDAYFRLASTFIALKCADGQLLIVQGMADSSIAPVALRNVAASACVAAAVARTEITVPLGGRAFPGFELRCVITKREQLAAKLSQIEQADPMSALKARLQSAAGDPAGELRLPVEWPAKPRTATRSLWHHCFRVAPARSSTPMLSNRYRALLRVLRRHSPGRTGPGEGHLGIAAARWLAQVADPPILRTGRQRLRVDLLAHPSPCVVTITSAVCS
jgi:hypothetical protein